MARRGLLIWIVRAVRPASGELDQQAAYQLTGNGINGQATPLSFAASGRRTFGESSVTVHSRMQHRSPANQEMPCLPV